MIHRFICPHTWWYIFVAFAPLNGAHVKIFVTRADNIPHSMIWCPLFSLRQKKVRLNPAMCGFCCFWNKNVNVAVQLQSASSFKVAMSLFGTKICQKNLFLPWPKSSCENPNLYPNKPSILAAAFHTWLSLLKTLCWPNTSINCGGHLCCFTHLFGHIVFFLN